MTVTAQQQAEHQAQQNAVLVLAASEWLDQIAEFESLPPKQAAAMAREVLAELVNTYGDEAASVNADWYNDLRVQYADEFGLNLPTYAALLADPWESDAVQGQLTWAMAPLFLDTPDFEAAESRIDGKLEWLIGEMGRDTIVTAAAGDPIGTTYARYARDDACAFCRLMATRGATYLTKESALFVTGDIDPRTREASRPPRGPQPEGKKYHDDCRCTAVPQFPGDTLEQAPHVAQWFEDYKAAAKLAGGSRRADLSEILANMREMTGAR